MMTRDWKPVDWLECPACGGDSIEVHTSAESGYVNADDDARCAGPGCDWEGCVTVDDSGLEGDPPAVWLQDGNLEDLCEECNRLSARCTCGGPR